MAIADAVAFLFLMMQYADRYVQTAATIIQQYDGDVPLQHYLKQFFAAHKKYGSKDRKAISHACYCFYRLGHSLQHLPVEQRIKTGIFLCTANLEPWKNIFDESHMLHDGAGIMQRISFIQSKYPFDIGDIFPWKELLSEGMDAESFIAAHLIQPDLYIRIRPGYRQKVHQSLTDAGIGFQSCGDDCLALPNTSPIGQLLQINKEVVVQDLSSQRIAALLQLIKSPQHVCKIWDCCAASGGKSILAKDVLGQVQLTVSDLRPSIIRNLQKRFAEAGISQYHSFVADLCDDSTSLPPAKFNLVICDAPCSGSGTWSRNPEQLYFFTEDKIAYYAAMQKKIASKAAPAVADGGYFLYITCSVFKEENENVVEYLQQHSGLRLQKAMLLKGYDKKADTMFAALFTSSL